MTRPALSLTARALRLLAQREHSRLELERKLARFEAQPGALAAVLDTLQAKDFINEARVLESVVHRRSARVGALRIRQELQDKGLDAQAVALAVAQLRSTEVARAHAVWQRKFDRPAVDAPGRARQMRFLAARGFSGDTIGAVLRAVRAAAAEGAAETSRDALTDTDDDAPGGDAAAWGD